MSNVPKIVLKRLQSAPVESHPDADLLTAFVERSLPASERGFVLDHISRCGDCREVVALALPAAEAVNVARAARPVRTGWFAVPVLRWGVVVLGVLAIASVGVLEYQQRQQEKEKLATALIPRDHLANSPRIPAPASQTSPPPETPPRSQVQTAPGKETSRMQAIDNFSAEPSSDTSLVKRAAPTLRSFPSAPGPTASANRNAEAGPTTIRRPQSPTVSQMAAAESSPAAGTTVEVTGAAPAINTQSAQASGQLTQNQRNLPLQGRNFTQLVTIGKAKDPVPTPLWTISPKGDLRRSLDAGRTWVAVNVNAAPVTTVAEMNVANQEQADRGYYAHGSIAGTVTDATGAVVPDAGVTLTNLGTAETWAQSSASDGHFTFANLLPGQYRIDVEKQGFKHFTRTPVGVDAQLNARFDAKLQVGDVSETVEVISAAPTLQTETLSVGTAEQTKKNRPEQKQNTPQPQNRQLKSSSNTVPVFHALAANGPEVWAGGAAAMLYHSLDAGAHWTRVLPSSAGAVLTGDITTVQFSDPQHGTVITSTAEIWSTADGGQIWQKLP